MRHYGTSTSSDSIASDNAAKAGIIVVAAAGNEGPAPYVTGDPSTATHAISAAAMNARAFLVNGVHIALSSGGGVNGVEANSLKLPSGSVPAIILDQRQCLSLGCNASDYPERRRRRDRHHFARHLQLRPEGRQCRRPPAR